MRDWPYRAPVDSLIRLTAVRRLDTSNAVRAVARRSHNPMDRHCEAVMKIMAFFTGALTLTFIRG